jgi:hypothetical protein
MLTEIYYGQAALEAALLADLSRNYELNKIQTSLESITAKLTELINQIK